MIYTSDHGEMLGHHGFWAKGLAPYEDAQRVPLVIAGASIAAIGSTQALANLVDLPQTILRLAAIDAPLGMQGKDLTPVLTGAAASVQDSTVIECRATAAICQHTFVTLRHKLIIYEHTSDGELYDLQKDPDQYDNLWHRPPAQALKSELLLRFLQRRMDLDGTRSPRVSFA